MGHADAQCVSTQRRRDPPFLELGASYVPPEPGQQYRHNDSLDPLWNLFDVTPEGRGDFEPKLEYKD